MSNNLAIRLTTAGQVFISRNRKVGHPWRWGKIAVTVVVLATAGVFFTSLFLAWADLQYHHPELPDFPGPGDAETVSGPEPQASY